MAWSESETLLQHVAEIEGRCRALRRAVGDPSLEHRAAPPNTARALLTAHDKIADELGGDAFRMPAIRMVLDLLLAQEHRKRISVSSLCVASGIPQTTALRWIAKLTEDGHLTRYESLADRRRAYVDLTPDTAAKLRRVLSRIDLVQDGTTARATSLQLI